MENYIHKCFECDTGGTIFIYVLNVPLVEHFTGAALLDKIFQKNQETTFRPFETGLQIKKLKFFLHYSTRR